MITVKEYAGRTVAVMGLGKSGLSTARALSQAGAQVWVWDDNPARRHDAREHEFRVVDLLTADWSQVACLVWSPGIPHTFPRPHPVAVAARAAGIEPVCDIDLLVRTNRTARTIGITGTNGKSTTTALIAHILQDAGRPVAVGGNLGTPVLDFPELGEDGIYVIELSSYQLELTPSLALDAAVMLNITPDHLGRHGGMEGYIDAKRRIFAGLRPGGRAVIGIDDEPSRGLRDDLQATLPMDRVVPISSQGRAEGGVYAADGMLLDETSVGTGDAVRVLDLASARALPGRHNWQNAAAACAVTRAMGVAPEAIARAMRSFPGLAHRQERVAVIDGVTYINDSKATNADAAEKAMSCYDTLYWIAGGQAKEGGITPLAPLFPRVRHAFLIGEAAHAFGETLAGRVAASQCGDLATAIARAHALATRERLPGAVVLLSPACASWDQFTSFEARGAAFRHIVEALPGGRDAPDRTPDKTPTAAEEAQA